MKNIIIKKHLILVFILMILISASFIGVNLLKSNQKKEMQTLIEKTISQEETRNMLSYTINGEKADIKPTKESGYIANKISCENGSNLIWDNTNWEVEIISLESNDVCSIDFTKEESTNGYRVTATTNIDGSIDSLSKATIENGTIIFYPTEGQEITSVSGCTGVLENNKVIVSNVTGNQTCNIEAYVPKTFYMTLSDGIKYVVGTRTSFSTPFGGEEATQGYNQTGKIYLAEDNYYFAGNPSDNWVKFAEFWWRIIRTNAIEGTRLLYAGTSHDGQEGYINGTTYKWNNNVNSAIYLQWSNTSFKSTLNSWYIDNIIGENDVMVNNIEYCNDLSYRDQSNGRLYGAGKRVIAAKTPSHLCETNSFGNEAKVGMMTADEVAFAGGVVGKNAPNTYYYRNSLSSRCTGSNEDSCSVTRNYNWWTLSPSMFTSNIALVLYVYGSNNNRPGDFGQQSADNSSAVRPVITLKPEVKVSGSGTTDDPFIPSLN